jgi:hypothetical protein
MPEPKRNIGASVRARLLNLSKQRGQPFDLLLTRYAIERLLYRLSTTKHRERFTLKGAMLITTWFDTGFRPTRDCKSASNLDPPSFYRYVVDTAPEFSIFKNVHRRPTVTPAILENKTENQRVGMAPPGV